MRSRSAAFRLRRQQPSTRVPRAVAPDSARIRPGSPADLPAVRDLLGVAGLPTADLTSAPGLQLWVLEVSASSIVGAIALERSSGHEALLRSLVIGRGKSRLRFSVSCSKRHKPTRRLTPGARRGMRKLSRSLCTRPTSRMPDRQPRSCRGDSAAAHHRAAGSAV